MYTLIGDSLTKKLTFTVKDQVTDASFSPDGQNLVITVGKNLILYNTTSYEVRE